PVAVQRLLAALQPRREPPGVPLGARGEEAATALRHAPVRRRGATADTPRGGGEGVLLAPGGRRDLLHLPRRGEGRPRREGSPVARETHALPRRRRGLLSRLGAGPLRRWHVGRVARGQAVRRGPR